MEKYKHLAELILAGEQLEQSYKDHQLIGDWHGWRDCHIESDWVLIYKIAPPYVIFGRMGSHSELRLD